MGPKQMSLAAFTPDNYSDDEDDKFFHGEPGAGWTNGQIPPQFTPAMTLHPFTRSGRLSLYNHHRRWINFQSSWSRIGDGTTELDAVHSESSGGKSVMTGCLVEEGRTVRALVAQLCECFYKTGFVDCAECSGVGRIGAGFARWRRTPCPGIRAVGAISASRGAAASVVVVLDPRYRVDCCPQIS